MNNYKKIIFGIAALIAASPAFAVRFNSGAAVNSGFSLSNGTDLATGNLVRIGVFTVSDSTVTSNATSFSFLNSNFVQIGTSYIGQGNPAAGSSETDPANNGLFNSSILSVNTTASGLNIVGSQVSYWVFNAVTASSATQCGIFSSSLSSWTVTSGDGSGLDLSAITTDISDLTNSGAGVSLAGTAKILVGSLGSGTNVSGGGKDFMLSAIPEPSSYAALFGVAALGACLLRRRRKVA